MSRARQSVLPRILLAAVGLGLALAEAAQAAYLPVEPGALLVSEVDRPDGIITPGESLDIRKAAVSHGDRALSGVTASLEQVAGAVSVLSGDSAYPDLAPRQPAENATPFRVFVSRSAACGETLRLAVRLRRGDDTAVLPVEVHTGAPGAFVDREAADVPRVIPDEDVLRSEIAIGGTGRVKDVRVRIGRLAHEASEHVRLTLISPSGTRVPLAEVGDLDGTSLRGTVFAVGGAPLAGAGGARTGTFAPAGDLRRLEGEPAAGRWTLEATDTVAGVDGTLEAWGLDLAAARCDGAPVATFTATPDPVRVGEDVTLDASGSSDPGPGGIVAYDWDLDGNGSFELRGADPIRRVSFPTRRSARIGLRTTNDRGDTATTSRTVAVTAPPVATFSFEPRSPATGDEVTLDASAASDPDGVVSEYAWDLDGDGRTDVSGSAPVRIARFPAAGRRTVSLRVTDDDGATASAGRVVDVANRAPNVRLKVPRPALAGTPASLDASAATDPDGTVVSFAWDLDGLPGFEVSGGPAIAEHTWAVAGRHVLGVRVTDDSGAWTDDVAEVMVTAPPVALLRVAPRAVRPGVTVRLDASASSDPDGSVAAVDWDLDGERGFEASSGTSLVHELAFSTPGRRMVRVRVTDDTGASAVASAEVDVVNRAPVARLSPDAGQAVAARPVTLDASSSGDAEGPLTRFEWDLDGNGAFETDGGRDPRITRAFPNPAVIRVGVRVTDGDGATGTATASLTVMPGSGSGPAPATDPGPALALAPGPGPSLPRPGASGVSGGPGPTGTQDSSAGAGAGTGADPVFSAGLTGAPIQRLRTVARDGLAVGCSADRAAACTLVLEIAGADARRLRLVPAGRRGRAARPHRVATLRLAPRADAPASARVRLAARLRRALGTRRTVTVTVRGTATPAGGGDRLALTRSVVLRP